MLVMVGDVGTPAIALSPSAPAGGLTSPPPGATGETA